MVLPFWYPLTRVVPDKGPLNGCVCVCVCLNLIVGSWFDFQVTYSKTACHSGWNRWVVRTLICDCVSLHAHVTEISAWSAVICEWKLSDSWLLSSRLLIHSVHWRTYVLPLLLVCFFFYIFIAFSALMLLVGWQEVCPAWVVRCWRGYLSGVRCRLVYGPADATATHCLLM